MKSAQPTYRIGRTVDRFTATKITRHNRPAWYLGFEKCLFDLKKVEENNLDIYYLRYRYKNRCAAKYCLVSREFVKKWGIEYIGKGWKQQIKKWCKANYHIKL